MKQKDSAGYLSILGVNYLFPIATLLEKLNSLEQRDPNEVQCSPLENGYSISLVVLGVMMVESFIRRTQYLVQKKDIRSAIEFVRGEFPDYDRMDHLEELFVIRDVVAHNLVWDAQISWGDEFGMRFNDVAKGMGGDKKFDRVIDMKKRISRQLSLNLFPTRINRSDVIKIMNSALDFLLFLENKNRNFVYITPQFMMIDNIPVSFVEYVRGLRN